MKHYLLATAAALFALAPACDGGDRSTGPRPVLTEFKPATNASIASVQGALVYVPAYSSNHYRHEGEYIDFTSVLSIHNTSPSVPIRISRIEYYDTNGKRLKSFIAAPHVLGTMATADFVVEEGDIAGGSGANFLVRWDAEKPVSKPLIEAVMFGSIGTAGFSFASRGQDIEPH